MTIRSFKMRKSPGSIYKIKRAGVSDWLLRDIKERKQSVKDNF